MPTTIVLAVCLDSLLPGPQAAAWSSAGYIFITANSIKDAIDHFKAGDFDLVVLGQSLPADARERLTFLVRATGSRVPVVCLTGASGHSDSFADATFEHDSKELFTSVGELVRNKANCGQTRPSVAALKTDALPQNSTAR